MSQETMYPPSETETRLDKLGIPHSIRWGFLGVLIFMTGDGVESNFIAPHMKHVLAGAGADLVPTIIAMYSLSALIASYLSGALADLVGPRRIILLGFVIWAVFEALFLGALTTGSVGLVFATYFLRGFGFPLFAFGFLVWINAVAPFERMGLRWAGSTSCLPGACRPWARSMRRLSFPCSAAVPTARH
jgi:predicted MFS family arabinose efflux permease